MDPRTVLANRIDLGLRRHLGEGVDPQRTLTDALYQRDVLLVCDSMTGTDLPVLARQFRVAGERILAERAQQAVQGGRQGGPAQDWAVDTSGFGVSTPPAAPKAEINTSWFAPSRWLS